MTAVQARVHFALKQELKLLAVIIRDFSDDDYGYEPEGNQGPRAKSSDYKHVDIIPVSDPNAATMSQRVVQYQAVIQMAQMAPDIYDLPQLHRRMLEVLGIKNPDKLIPLEEDMKPVDPVTENQSILKGKPVKAFLHQDHKSHIAVHNSMPQDPSIAALIGQNPQAPKISAALQAHIAEHVGYMMRQQIEAQLGMPLPPEDEKLPPEIEIALSAMMAQAAQQVVQQNQAQAAQQQAQQQQQDPVVQMQQAELQIKQQEVQIKQQEAQMRMQLEQAKMQIEQAKMQMAQQTAQQELEFKNQQMQITAASAADKQKLEEQKVSGQLQLDGMRIGAQIEESQAKQQFDQAHMGARLDLDVADTKTKNAMQAAQIMETARNLQKGNTPK
jgi:hypothetical protein